MRAIRCSLRWSGVLFALVAGGMLPAESFYPDDPYFNAEAPGVVEGYYGQWHLDNQMPISSVNAGLDVNILGAWDMGYTGEGVIIGVLDDGMQGDHPDLVDNFHNEYSWDFGQDRGTNLGSSYRGSPSSPGNNHGTSVGGVAAAVGGNGIGTTGAAPQAGLAGMSIIDVEFSSEEDEFLAEAAAILYQGQLGTDGQPDPFAAYTGTDAPIRVKNHSYGDTESYDDSEYNYLLVDALNESMSRNVVHVYAAGNQRRQTPDGWDNNFDSTKEAMLNVPGLVVVAALGSDGEFADYSNYGSNIFVTAPSNSAYQYEIATTDRSGNDGYNEYEAGPDNYFDNNVPGHASDVLNYTSSFGGTSSAAPLVSGIMALGVQANANMNARLAQHLLVRTSRVVDEYDYTRVGGWVTNGAGNRFNRNYGFGLIDATAFVQEAARGGHVTEQTYFVGEQVAVNEMFSEIGDTISWTYTVDGIDAADLQPIEYVLVNLIVSELQTDIGEYGTGEGGGIGTIAGDLEAYLTSPDGTRQMLFTDDRAIPAEDVADRAHDVATLDWDFLSYAYWGEMPEGDWILELVNNTGNELTGNWEGFQFEIGMGDYVVPEPGTYALIVGLGVLGLLIVQRRKRT